MFKEWKRRRVLSAALIAGLALAATAGIACGGDDDDDTTPTTAAATTGATTAASTAAGTTAASPSASAGTKIDYTKLSGSVRIDGSSTVFPISEAVAEEFSQEAKNVRANVAFSGTGGGFEKFCRGEIEFSNASRPINQGEKDKCTAAGITDVVELQVAIDALTVVVNPQNTWAQCMTPAQLQKLYQNGGATKWSDIDASWPAEDITFYYPGADSGTFDYFKEAIKLRGEASKEPAHRSDGTASEDDNVLVRGVEGDKNAIGYFGFAFFLEEGSKLKAVNIDGGKGCVTPSFDAALKAEYVPLSRPLFIYTRESFLKEKPEVLGFAKFYLDNMNELSKEVGYISLPEALTKTQQDKVTPFIK